MENLRNRLAARLPDMLAAALAAYDAIALSGHEPEDARALGNQQSAAKSALRHIEMILKLAEAVLPPAAGDDNRTALLEAARAALDGGSNSGPADTLLATADGAS